nr:formin-like protein 4 [Ipomoea batatas]
MVSDTTRQWAMGLKVNWLRWLASDGIWAVKGEGQFGCDRRSGWLCCKLCGSQQIWYSRSKREKGGGIAATNPYVDPYPNGSRDVENESFKRQIFNNGKKVEEKMMIRRGSSKQKGVGTPIHEIPLLRGKSSTSHDPAWNIPPTFAAMEKQHSLIQRESCSPPLPPSPPPPVAAATSSSTIVCSGDS